MTKLHDILATTVDADTAAKLAETIEAAYILKEREPPPDKTFSRNSVSVDMWRRDDEWHMRTADGLVMNVEGSRTEDEAKAYAAEQIGIKKNPPVATTPELPPILDELGVSRG